MRKASPLLVSMYIYDPSPSCIKQLARLFNLSVPAVMARLYRAGAIASAPQQAMFYTDDQIAEAYLRLRSRMKIAEEMGISFYTVTAALRRKGVELNPARQGGRNTEMRTFYYWKCRSHEPELEGVEFIVGSRSRGNHMGTIRARSPQEALERAPGKAVSQKQADTLNRVRSVPVYNRVLKAIGSPVPLMPERERVPLPRRELVFGKTLIH